jgi:hypothetical protein
MSTMTRHQACRPRGGADAAVGAPKLEWLRGAAAFARDTVCVMLLSDGTTGIEGTSKTSRAFLAGEDM